MLHGFDHAIIGVHDVARAEVDFRALGFTVSARPDVGATETENRLICFADGSYVEIFSLRDPDQPSTHRWAPLLATGNGWLDYALHVDSVAGEAARLAPSGLPSFGPRSGGRPLTDGRRWGVAALLYGRGVGSPVLPFMIEDTETRAVRVPDGPATAQPQGAAGIVGVTVVTSAVAAVEASLAAIFGPGAAVARADAAAARRYEFAGRWVEVVEPADGASDAAQHLRSRGEGVFEVTLGQPGRPTAGAGVLLAPTATQAARLRLVG
jgi:hypothetical protein